VTEGEKTDNPPFNFAGQSITGTPVHDFDDLFPQMAVAGIVKHCQNSFLAA